MASSSNDPATQGGCPVDATVFDLCEDGEYYESDEEAPDFETPVPPPSPPKLEADPFRHVYDETNPEAPFEQTMEQFRSDLREQIAQMMYVSGETGEPSVETTGIIEEVVRQQVVEIVGHGHFCIHSSCIHR